MLYRKLNIKRKNPKSCRRKVI